MSDEKPEQPAAKVGPFFYTRGLLGAGFTEKPGDASGDIMILFIIPFLIADIISLPWTIYVWFRDRK